MNGQKTAKKLVSVTLSQQDYQCLARLAQETCRTPAGYLRWLLHLHLKNPGPKEAAGK